MHMSNYPKTPLKEHNNSFKAVQTSLPQKNIEKKKVLYDILQPNLNQNNTKTINYDALLH